jgi:hypothetical protein
VLGGDDPGRVLWAPQVFDMATEYGLVLLENGVLIDTAVGQTLPPDVAPMRRTTAEQVAALHRTSASEAERLVWRAGARHDTTKIIGAGAWLDWPHPFTLDLIAFNGEAINFATPSASEVIFCHAGVLTIAWDDGNLALNPGDTMTVPIGLSHTRGGTPDTLAYRVSGQVAA